MKKYAIIVAGGSGTRMGSAISKQYLEIGNKPILMHSLEKFFKTDSTIKIILVIPEEDFDFWKSLCSKFNFTVPHQLIKGGKSRFQSVKNGLEHILDFEGIVAIHDGVRPFVQPEVIMESYEVAAAKGSAIAVVTLKDSIRKMTEDGKSFSQERQYFRLVQTPQTFQVSKIKKAFETKELQQFTDDATVYEHQGWQVSLIAGNLENIKITTPEDMAYANFLLGKDF
ncbi:MAG: 2-C-methyl-D-erythritol 4-phosphate cytidylyltransferase [Mongoliibacter sp.]|uniref:2-C-methyl-D-erythritol 4-phosphate cytidylyltransferase n=1 Tax=Mongoliibacter sp. TaxID=2022438 RepID=UPI0012F34CF6|nr:2-C-methyl-D-erythritol 4-phosphate cytidylyltransferase [Mongoliibacter sp.]TVP51591.1 MAG: 2-C-methyl-D-erythritol 4-phosphate cytidylyltransferase [Mongoliibacter sp.]